MATNFPKEQFENGTLKPITVSAVPQGIFRDCPACCIGPFCRDGDVELYHTNIPAYTYFECGYTFAENEACGFRYPGNWAANDPRIEELAAIRREYLRGLRDAQLQASEQKTEVAATA